MAGQTRAVLSTNGREYVGRKLLSREVFAQARQEYQRATANYASAHYPEFLGKFTVRNPGLRTTTFRKDEEFLDQAEIATTDWAECLRNTRQLRLRFLS